MPAGVKIALQKCPVKIKTQEDLRKIRLILRSRGRAEAHSVAKVIGRKPGHDGIEIEHASCKARFFVQQDVIELRVVVCHPQRQRAAAQHPAERAKLLLTGGNERKLRPGLPDAAAGVGLH